MDYRLAIEGAPDTVPGGSAVLLLHPSTGETDRIDTDFLKTDTDAFLVISTRTTAREVMQKLDHYGVAERRTDADREGDDDGDGDGDGTNANDDDGREGASAANERPGGAVEAVVLDALSVDRGYSRRSAENVRYVSAPDDVEGILAVTEEFLATHEGKRRVSFDSLTELAYYADEEAALDALERMVRLLEAYDAVGLFHVSEEVHDAATIRRFRALCDGVVDLDEDGTITVDF